MSEALLKVLHNDTFQAHSGLFGTPPLAQSSTRFEGKPLMFLIYMTETSEAKFSRDRLFALLGLANDLDDEEFHLLRPDYEKPLEWVICRYASVLVRKGQGMDILYRGFLRPGSSKVPSWVGDWTSPLLPAFKNSRLSDLGEAVYQAAGRTAPRTRIGGQENILVATGGLVDTIERVEMGAIMDKSSGIYIL